MFDVFLTHFLQHGGYFLRIVIAGISGAIIGYERKNRMKEAGIRTHLIVAIGSALMMVVSKYGFFDTVTYLGKADGSRIASQIVTGVGFLGAGTIFVRQNVISGLTTAAGLWATAGIGMAIGAGMYGVGIATAILIILVQFLFHGHFKLLSTPSAEQISIKFAESDDVLDNIRLALSSNSIEVLNMKMERNEANVVELEIYAKFPANYNKVNLIELFIDNENVKSVQY